MKTCFLVVMFAATALRSYCQPIIVFANLGPGLDAPVTNVAGYGIIGPGPYVADLFWSHDTQASMDQLIAAGFNVGFSSWTRNGGGYFLGGGRSLPPPYDSPVAAQVRVWDTTFGTTYAQARDNGGEFGFSNIIQVTPDWPPGSGAFLWGLQGFQLQVIPEPSPLGLAVLGTIVTVVSRLPGRRKTAREKGVGPLC